jgi:hypothetical protein
MVMIVLCQMVLISSGMDSDMYLFVKCGLHMNKDECQRFGRTLTGILSSIIVLFARASLLAQTFSITDVRVNGTGVDIQFESSANDYYLLYTGTDLTNINRAVSVRLGQEATTSVEHFDSALQQKPIMRDSIGYTASP